MTTEEKAKAWDEAIERAKSKIRNDKDHVLYEEDILDIFPSLKESDEERIRKALMQNLKERFGTNGNMGEGLDMPNVLAWLEKQGEHANFRNKIQIGDKVTRNEDGVLVNLSQLNRVVKKQGEQKLADKVEPKFKAGDWIITNKNHICYIDETPETTSYLYRLINQYGKVEVAEFEVVDKKARLWTIQDAKNGDVLVSSSGKPFIFKGFFDNDPMAYGGLVADDSFWPASNSNWTTVYCKPATKEQRDLLFQKMKEAGYEWDAEKKELKMIEQNPQSQWKPSAEQMKFLWKYAEQNNYDGSILTSLYNDLKKLRQE